MQVERKSFLFYFEKYKDKIYTYFYYRVNYDRDLAEDLTSEVFLKAFKNFGVYDEAKPFQAWIFAISRNHLINHYRVSGREFSLEEDVKAPPNDLLQKIGQKEEAEKIIEVIKDFDEYHRDVLLLRFVDDLSNKEIAEVLKKDEGAIRVQISRALNKLRDIINKKI